ncbi:LysM peptidoglycan-binding domain-containing protein [Endozoicomonas sp. ONNA2]|uniref:LysM peptidoglycan-binding domain-containing protein n=1 Tax=Endozoicomonas sp. ONNA2 TaxID=2828741 RepID=UPI0021487D17|nr:LysM peptidoglycan-binding domain-containing protein [Endozoicomonas sp. ONNA2]
MKHLLIIGLAFGLTACSDSKQREVTANRDKELLPLSENPDQADVTKPKDTDSFSNNPAENESKKQNTASTSYQLSNFATAGTDINNLSYSQNYYTVNQNDTLMKIAFEIYGDYEQWIVIKDSNPGKIGSKNIIKEGAILTYPEPARKFVQNKKGDPYLIKHGDTLSSISKNLYGSSRHWKAIWKNNTAMIKNPNKIFAGFTIYIPDINE